MKLLTTNFLTCATKPCKSSPQSFPLHFKDAVLEKTEVPFQPLFMKNILPRINWDALKITTGELGLSKLVPERNPVEELREENEGEEEGKRMKDVDEGLEIPEEVDEEVLRRLHGLLLETGVSEGKLVCENCGFEYPIKEGVGNFLLPAHLV